ncbi:AMP-dependent synthetase [Haloglomus irregulare]|jgi:acyl-CoA synthetase (AMP-forming)/AMP-acid ligase II|uniref:AMP-dependent synthetase n=1 Tax=Haloglomus irregulare TaxID=2234134 RepID=A0A554N958_9EURY|nr:AMP-binding protein [Haloglomus irregulare]TSD13947.1 AMP-dependent synthetase [Haloglomus irregulare]
MNFANYLDMSAAESPDDLAVTDPQRDLTYRELAGETDAFANALADLGVAPGDRVALYLPNSTAFVAAYFGAMKHGAIPFPINMRFEGSEVEYVLDDAGASALVTVGQFEDAAASFETDALEHLIVAGGERGHAYGSLVAEHAGPHETHPRRNDELAELVYTSGTTGRPKGVKHTHGNLSANADGLIAAMDWTSDEVALTVCPCFHVSGLNVTTTPFIVAGAENHLLPQWDIDLALSTMAERDVTYAFFIPTMLVDVLNEGIGDHDLSSLSTVGVGGSPMPRERIDAAEELLDIRLLEGYGMTETTPLAAINTPDQDVYKAGSIGPPAREVVDVRIEDPETKEPVDTDQKGEMLWHGDTITPGYLNLPEKNDEAFVEREGKRWLRSGDVARMDADGHLFVEDRIDDMIITGGENVYPREVEEVLYGIDGVAEAAVVGAPDDRLGERIVAFVVGDVTAEDLEAGCRGTLTDYKVPREFRVVDALPKTSTRKMDKVALRERFD